MAILSGATGKHIRRRENILRGENENTALRALPSLRITGVVRLHGESKKNKK